MMTDFRKSLLLTTAVAATLLVPGVALAGEITWWAPNWGTERAQKLADDFHKAHPDITVRIETTTSTGLPERVMTALQSGSGPDVIDVQHPWVQGYAQQDLVLPLDDVIKDKADYNPAAINYVTYQDHLYGVPYRVECIGVIFNVDDFTKAGLDPNKPPQTWDEWSDYAKKLTADGRYGMAITGGGEQGNTITRSLPLIWMNGGDVISKDGKTAQINSPEAVAAIQFYTDFYKNGFSPPSTLQNDGVANRQLFVANQVAMYQSGQYDIAPIQKAAPDLKFGAFPIPHPEGKPSACLLTGWSFVVPKDAPNPTDAKTFIQFLGEADNQGYYTDTFPARQSALSLPRFQDPLLKPFAAALKDGRPAPNNPQWVQVQQAMFNGIQRVLTGQQTAQQAMDQANDDIQALLDSE
jgi:ABC-type glycerol-3-phosphate transport system substrate-binding protein